MNKIKIIDTEISDEINLLLKEKENLLNNLSLLMGISVKNKN